MPSSETSDSGSTLRRISGASCRHVVALPYPGRGHVNPMMNLCKLLAARADVLITFVLTEEWIGLIGPAPELPNIRLRSIPNVIPSELNRASDLPGFVRAVNTNMEEPFELLIQEQLQSPVEVIIADVGSPWVLAVANRRKIAPLSLWTMSPSVFSVFYHFNPLTQNRHFPVDLSERGEEIIDYIPGLSSTRLADFPTIFSGVGRELLDEVLKAFSLVRRSQCVIFTSFYELEPHVIDTLKITLPFPIYSVGPLIPHTTLADDTHTETSHDKTAQPDYFKWLDLQPKRSVLYISMGSFLSISREKMDEIVAGVRASGVRFLWMARGDTERLQEACGEMGLVVPWCDQLKVLCHVSVGGFWTHCGWNSALEGVFAGVPMLTFPISFDQIPDRKLIVDDWKVGMKVVGVEEVVRREEIANIVRKFMGLEGGESEEMRKRASGLKQRCHRALAKDGSSETDLNCFIRDILKCQVTSKMIFFCSEHWQRMGLPSGTDINAFIGDILKCRVTS